MAVKPPAKKNRRGIDVSFSTLRAQQGGFTFEEAAAAKGGIYIPDYAERWVRDSNVYSLGMIEMHVGEQGSGKSTQLLRQGRTFLDAGGYFIYVETEGKYSAAFLRSVLGDRADSDRFLVINAASMGDDEERSSAKSRKNKMETQLAETAFREQGWMGHIARVIDWARNNAPGMPVLIGLDTITSAPGSEYTRTYRETEGSLPVHGAHDMHRAKTIKNWLTQTHADIRETNISLVFTNHVTESIEMSGRPGWKKPETHWAGGSALGQRSTCIVEYRRAGKDLQPDHDLVNVQVTVRKQSSGKETRSLRVQFEDRFQTDQEGKRLRGPDGEPLRIVYWRWPDATVQVLGRIFNPQHLPEYERLGTAADREWIKMQTTGSGDDRRYSLKGFAENDRENPVWAFEDLTALELAEAVEASAAVQRTLQETLHSFVARHAVYDAKDKEGEEDGDSSEEGAR